MVVMRLVKLPKMGGFQLTKWLSNDYESINESKLDPSIPIMCNEKLEDALFVMYISFNVLFIYLLIQESLGDWLKRSLNDEIGALSTCAACLRDVFFIHDPCAKQ